MNIIHICIITDLVLVSWVYPNDCRYYGKDIYPRNRPLPARLGSQPSSQSFTLSTDTQKVIEKVECHKNNFKQ